MKYEWKTKPHMHNILYFFVFLIVLHKKHTQSNILSMFTFTFMKPKYQLINPNTKSKKIKKFANYFWHFLGSNIPKNGTNGKKEKKI